MENGNGGGVQNRAHEAGAEIADIPSEETRHVFPISANVTINFFPEEGEVEEDAVVPMDAATSEDHFKSGTRVILKDLEGPEAVYNGLPGLITQTVPSGEGALREGGFRISVDASKTPRTARSFLSASDPAPQRSSLAVDVPRRNLKLEGSPVACFPLPADLLSGRSLAMQVMCKREGNLPAIAQSLASALQLELKKSKRQGQVKIHSISRQGEAVPTIKPFQDLVPGCVVQVAGEIDTSPEAQHKQLQLEAQAEGGRARGSGGVESACCAVM